MRLGLLLLLPLALGGCIAQTAVDIVTLPVKLAAAGVDAVTTSQKEADEKRGRKIREYEECVGKEERRARKDRREADHGRCAKLQPR
jgi:hypothetical protein